MRYTVKGAQAFAAAKAQSRKTLPAILLIALVIAVAIRLLERVNPGAIPHLLSTLKAIGISSWHMIRDFAEACAEFLHYVMRMRPG